MSKAILVLPFEPDWTEETARFLLGTDEAMWLVML